jgi:hypothetical protein
MELDLHTIVEIIIAMNAVALFIIGAMLLSFRRTVDVLRRMDERLIDRVATLEADTAGLKEWRRAHDMRHVELLTEIRDLKSLIMRLLVGEKGDPHGTD